MVRFMWKEIEISWMFFAQKSGAMIICPAFLYYANTANAAS